MKHFKPAHSLPTRIGLFGGTFNPIHIGHLHAAEEVRRQFALEQLLFIPCALPPHKSDSSLAFAMDRLEMVRIAIENRNALKVSDIEIQRGGPSYTVDTLLELKAASDDGSEFFFLIGIDAFLELHTWKSHHRLLDLTALIVMNRPDAIKRHPPIQSMVLDYTRQHISEAYALSDKASVLEHPEKKSIHLASVPPVAIASTRIRDMIRTGQPIHHWVCPEVSDYIENKGLYR